MWGPNGCFPYHHTCAVNDHLSILICCCNRAFLRPTSIHLCLPTWELRFWLSIYQCLIWRTFSVDTSKGEHSNTSSPTVKTTLPLLGWSYHQFFQDLPYAHMEFRSIPILTLRCSSTSKTLAWLMLLKLAMVSGNHSTRVVLPHSHYGTLPKSAL